jgi:signal peptidase II
MSDGGLSARRGYFFVSLVVLLLDQATKVLAHRFLAERAAVEIVPGFFSLWYSRNPGGLFGSFREWSATPRFLLLTLLPLVAIVFIATYLSRLRGADRPTLVGLALILGGATGNLVDRLVRGEVIDFLDVYLVDSVVADWLVRQFGTSHWPTFNVADSSIVVGASLLMLGALAPQRVPEAKDVTAEPRGSS